MQNTTQTIEQEDSGITHIWSRFNPRWIFCGALSGILAGSVVLLVASYLSAKNLGEWSQALKMLGATFYGPEALAFGPLSKAAIAGGLLHYALSVLYGVTFAQLVSEYSSKTALIILALVTTWVIWIFGAKLFLPSVNTLIPMVLSTPMSLLLHFIFGLSFGIFIGLFGEETAD